MVDFLSHIKTFFVVVLASASTFVTPIHPSPTPILNPVNNPEFVKLASENTSLPLNEENYIYVQGTYSYLGQSVHYLALVPKKGGSFKASVTGVCEAQASGKYEGGEGGKVEGTASGSCTMFGQTVNGSTNFSGKLFPETKIIELDIENSPIHGLNVKYN